MKSLVSVLSLLLLSACASKKLTISRPPNPCEKTRAAFDIGSGTTRVLVGQVNACENRILKVLLEASEAVPYQDQKQSDGNISELTLKQGHKVLSQLKEKATSAGATEFRGVATEVFRKAKNGEAHIQSESQKLGFTIKIIDQEMEGRLGYLSARALIPNSEGTFVVWDMGGGSTQVTYQKNAHYHYYFPKIGSVTFKDQIVKEALKKDPSLVKSPNPLGKNAVAAQRVAKKFLAKEKIPSWLAELAYAKKIRTVYGIGGVFAKSVQNQAAPGQSFFTAAELKKALPQQAQKSDEELGGKYASTQVSNLILIDAFLDRFKISKVYTLDVNLSQGLILDPLF